MNLVIHPKSEQLLTALVAAQPHAVLLTGAFGVGLSTISQVYAAKGTGHVTTVLPEKESKVDIEKGTITVEAIRRLYDITRTLEPAGRTIVIDYAERMAPAAQNAFLKLLEEPSEGTRFFIVTHQPERLLPTITSRSQRVDIRPSTAEQSAALLDTLGVKDATKRAQLLFIAEGLPAQLIRLVNDETAFAARATLVKDARDLVTGSLYTRMLLAKKYKDSRPDALVLVEDALKLLRRTLTANGDVATLKKLTRFETIHQRLSEQGNVRLQLSATVVL